MVSIRQFLPSAAGALLLLASCSDGERGPIVVSAIGGEPRLVNPNLEPLDPPSAFLVEAAAQGLVHFDPLGQVEPALAQSWIVSDDGLRYTFRLKRTDWSNGSRVTAEQVAQRLRAAISRASRNPLKPVLGVVAEIEAMTDEVLEITLVAPRPNFLQLLAQPEMAIIRHGMGTGPYRVVEGPGGALLLSLEEEDAEANGEPSAEASADVVLRGEGAALASVRFTEGLADLVSGGTVGDLPVARAAAPPADALRFDPVGGLFGLAFATDRGLVADAGARRALSMAIDREALVAALEVPELQPRATLFPAGVAELATPVAPDWAALPLPARRQIAARTIAGLDEEERTLRVAMPAGPGYRLVFAHLRRDWRTIGIEAEAVAADGRADLKLVDVVAPANLASWYLRRFSCDASEICSEAADAAMATARQSPSAAERQAALYEADRLLTDAAVFIPVTAPVRWSLVAQRLTGFQANPFARHFVGRLAAPAP